MQMRCYRLKISSFVVLFLLPLAISCPYGYSPNPMAVPALSCYSPKPVTVLLEILVVPLRPVSDTWGFTVPWKKILLNIIL